MFRQGSRWVRFRRGRRRRPPGRQRCVSLGRGRCVVRWHTLGRGRRVVRWHTLGRGRREHMQRSGRHGASGVLRRTAGSEPRLWLGRRCIDGTVPSCISTCGAPLVSKADAAQFASALGPAQLLCARFAGQGCQPDPPPPCAPLEAAPACVNGQCKLFVPRAWASVTFLETSSTTIPWECSGWGDCTSWSLTPDGTIRSSGGANATLDAAELKQVTGIIESVPFRQDFYDRQFPCAPSDSTRSLMLIRQTTDTLKFMDNVTGCIFVGPPGNDPQNLWEIVRAHFPVDAG